MRVDVNGEGRPNSWPNSVGGPAPDPAAGEAPFEISGLAQGLGVERAEVERLAGMSPEARAKATS